MKLVRVQTMAQLQHFMPFFREGYDKMCSKSNAKFTLDGFIKTLVGVLNTYPRNGILVVESDAGEPLGFGVAFEDTPPFEEARRLWLYALYSRSMPGMKVPETLFNECVRLAKEQGYDYLQAQSGRFAGQAINFYTERLGMKKQAMVYQYKL